MITNNFRIISDFLFLLSAEHPYSKDGVKNLHLDKIESKCFMPPENAITPGVTAFCYYSHLTPSLHLRL